jgi:hypothetical protein
MLICSPFFPYLALTVGLNLPPTLWGFKSFGSNFETCDTVWLHLNAVGTVLHMVAAFYIVHKIQSDQAVPVPSDTAEPVAYAAYADTGTSNNAADETTSAATTATKLNDNSKTSVEEGTHYRSMEGPGGRVQMLSHWTSASMSGPGSANSVQRLGQVLCYDAGVAVYIIIFCAWMVWQSIGMSTVLFGGSGSDDGDDGDDEDVCGQVEKWMVFSIICGFLYLMLVCFAFGCSILCLR